MYGNHSLTHFCFSSASVKLRLMLPEQHHTTGSSELVNDMRYCHASYRWVGIA